jgi:hypothetical protein
VEEISLSILNPFQRYPIYLTLHKILDSTKSGARYQYYVLQRTKPGRQARRYEQKWINRLGAPVRYGGLLENKRHEITPRKYKI